jgi:hypothetical protein
MVYLITAESFAFRFRDGAIGVCLSLPSNTTTLGYCLPHRELEQSYELYILLTVHHVMILDK